HGQADEAAWVVRWTGVGVGELVAHRGEDGVRVGSIPVTLVHTPGHTPGSQCLLVARAPLARDPLRAGRRPAEETRHEGHTGPVIIVGDERHAPYDRPPLSKQLLAGTWD